MNYTQKEKLVDKLCGAGLMLIFFEILYQVVNSSYTEFNYEIAEVTKWVYIGGGAILALAIGLLIYAYLKKSGSKACYGLELLVFAFTFALLPGCYLEFTAPFNDLRIVFPIFFFIYYIGKAIYIFKNSNKTINKKGDKNKKNAKKKKR